MSATEALPGFDSPLRAVLAPAEPTPTTNINTGYVPHWEVQQTAVGTVEQLRREKGGLVLGYLIRGEVDGEETVSAYARHGASEGLSTVEHVGDFDNRLAALAATARDGFVFLDMTWQHESLEQTFAIAS